MAYFTFDTAYIVASMQNTCNEAVKAAIRERLEIEYIDHYGIPKAGMRELLGVETALAHDGLEFMIECDNHCAYWERFDRYERALDDSWDSQCSGDYEELSMAGHECPFCGGHEFTRIRGRWECDPCAERIYHSGF